VVRAATGVVRPEGVTYPVIGQHAASRLAEGPGATHVVGGGSDADVGQHDGVGGAIVNAHQGRTPVHAHHAAPVVTADVLRAAVGHGPRIARPHVRRIVAALPAAASTVALRAAVVLAGADHDGETRAADVSPGLVIGTCATRWLGEVYIVRDACLHRVVK